jgi:mRNA interferase HigB
MRIISRRALREFWERHPAAKAPLSAWYRVVHLSTFSDFNALKGTFGSADDVAPYTVFDVGGNQFRIVAAIHYDRARLYIRSVFTHADYDAWSASMRKRTLSKRTKS